MQHITLTFWHATGYITAYGVFNLTDFMFRRELKNQLLLQFLHWFVDPLIGKETWRANRTTTDLSTSLTVCDEAYIYITIGSNYDKWLYLHQRTVSQNIKSTSDTSIVH